MCASLLSHVQFFVTLWTVACQAPLSTGFLRQEYWSGLPFPPMGDPPDPRDRTYISCISCIPGGFFTCWATGEAQMLSPRPWQICENFSFFPPFSFAPFFLLSFLFPSGKCPSTSWQSKFPVLPWVEILLSVHLPSNSSHSVLVSCLGIIFNSQLLAQTMLLAFIELQYQVKLLQSEILPFLEPSWRSLYLSVWPNRHIMRNWYVGNNRMVIFYFQWLIDL